MAPNDTEEYAADVEAEADGYPNQRGEILLEGVSAWRRSRPLDDPSYSQWHADA